MSTRSDIFHDPSYRFHPALVLDDTLSPRIRHQLMLLLGVPLFLSLLIAISLLWAPFPLEESLVGLIRDPAEFFLGIALVLFPLWFSLLMLGWFRNSYYYHVEALLERGNTGAKTPYTTPNYETNDIFFHTQGGDLLGSFLASSYGNEIAMRAGLKREDLKVFSKTRADIVDFTHTPDIEKVFTLRDLVSALLAFDPSFASFVFSHGVRPEDLSAASEWVERRLKQGRRKTRTWGRVALGKTRGVGSDLSYGVGYELGRYSMCLRRAAGGGRTGTSAEVDSNMLAAVAQAWPECAP